MCVMYGFTTVLRWAIDFNIGNKGIGIMTQGHH